MRLLILKRIYELPGNLSEKRTRFPHPFNFIFARLLRTKYFLSGNDSTFLLVKYQEVSKDVA